MIRWVVSLALKFRVLVVGAALVVLALGTVQLRDAPIDALPEFSPPQVEIQAEALGLSAAEVEQLITVPLEQDLLNGVAWLDRIRSESAPGLSSIDLVFQPGTDVLKARQAVQERLTQAHALPAVGTPPVMVQPLSSTSRVMMVGLSAQDLSLVDLSVLARWKIRPRLMGIPGVANVSIWGQRDRQLQVQVDPDQLKKNGVTLSQLITTAGNALWVSPLTFVEASTPGTGGFIDTSNQRLSIQHILPITTARNLSSVAIEDTTGRTLRLGDVASVVEDHQPLIGDAVLSGGPGLMLVVQKFPEASTRDVTRGVNEALDALRPGLSGIQMDTNVYQAQSFVDSALHNLGARGAAALIALFVMLAVLLFSWRMALVSVLGVVMSLLAAAYVLYLRGTTFNLMVVGGLAVALGMLIDDVVVDAVAIRTRLRERRDRGEDTSPVAVIAEVSNTMHGPLVFATIIVLLAPLPLVFLGDVAASFSGPAYLSYVVALLASMVVALTVTPVLGLLLLGNASSPRRRGSAVLRRVHRLFEATVARSVRRPRWTFAAVVVLLAAGAAVAPQLDNRNLLPMPQDRNVLVHWDAVPGTSLPEMARITSAAARDLRDIPGVRDVGAHLGRAVLSDQLTDVSSGELWVSLRDDADHDATVAAIAAELREYPGLRSEVQTYSQDRVHAAEAGTHDDLVVRVYGNDLAVLRTKAQEVQQRIAGVDGVVQPAVQAQPDQPTLEVQVDLAAAQRYGLTPGDVRRAASTFFSGLLVGNLYEDQKVFDVVVWGTPATRHTPANLADLRVETPTGDQVRLGDVAQVRITPYPTTVAHYDTSRYVDVSAGVSGRDVDSVLADVKQRVAGVGMPLEFHAEVLSGLTQQQGQDRRVAGVSVAVAIGVFLLLQAALGSWRLAAMLFLALPLAAVGGLLAAAITGTPMTLSAILGFFTILGIAARNGVLLVRRIQALELAEGVRRDVELVLRATRERAGPVLLTAIAIAAVMLPFAVLGGGAGSEVVLPLSIVVLGGLLTSTLLTLFVVPALYLAFSPRTDRSVQSVALEDY